MVENSEITIFILSGGKSSRMGKDKGLLMYQGKPMILHTIHKLKGLCNTIVINSNNPQYYVFGYLVVPDIYKDVGPMGGLHACLSVTKTKYNLILPCDMPLIDVALIENLIEHKEIAPIVMPQHTNGTLEPLLALYHSNLLQLINNYIIEGKYRVDLLLKSSEHYLVSVDNGSNKEFEYQFLNVNTQKDLNYEILS